MEAIKIYGLKEGMILTEGEEEILEVENYLIYVKSIWKWLLEK